MNEPGGGLLPRDGAKPGHYCRPLRADGVTWTAGDGVKEFAARQLRGRQTNEQRRA